jgi:hypothetical protein
MSDKDRAKKGNLDAAILGGFKSSSKRFAEYKQNGTDSGTWKTVVVPDMTGEEGHVPSKREWLERLFQLFDQYSQDFNKLVDEPHLISACYPPREQAQEHPLINAHQGLVSTKHWELVVRLQDDGISGFLLPRAMEENFLQNESLFERIFFIECVGNGSVLTWIFDGRTTEFSQLPSLARRCFGSLIEIARKEELEEFEDTVAKEPTIPMAAIEEAVGRRTAEPLSTVFPTSTVSNEHFDAGVTPELIASEFAPAGEFNQDYHLGPSTDYGNDTTSGVDLTGEQAGFKDLLSFGQSQLPTAEKEDPSYEGTQGHDYDTAEIDQINTRNDNPEPSGLSGLLKDNDANTEEIEMLKMEDGNITAALEMMKHSVDKELESLAKSGARAFENQDMSAVERAMKRTKKVKEFKEQLGPVLSLWERLEEDGD